jgi:hypothetical protein
MEFIPEYHDCKPEIYLIGNNAFPAPAFGVCMLLRGME